jgi:hypothetical protein
VAEFHHLQLHNQSLEREREREREGDRCLIKFLKVAFVGLKMRSQKLHNLVFVNIMLHDNDTEFTVPFIAPEVAEKQGKMCLNESYIQ